MFVKNFLFLALTSLAHANPGSDEIAGEYIVVFPTEESNAGLPTRQNVRTAATSMRTKYATRLRGAQILNAFRPTNRHDALLVKTDPRNLDALARQGAKVYPNKKVRKIDIQRPAPWNLARINTRKFDRSHDFYDYPAKAGEDVDVYVIDTYVLSLPDLIWSFFSGVDVNHPEFEGRARLGLSVYNSTDDGDGHGTHVAGTGTFWNSALIDLTLSVASRSYGVAKKANIIAVKVLDDEGCGTIFDIGVGIAYVMGERQRTGRHTIINMSLGLESDEFIDNAVERAADSGVYVVVAAGNENEDACGCSPAGSAKAITVGAINPSDQRAPFSNYGKCVDIFAPGTNIKSTLPKNQFGTLDGTSM